MPAIDPYKVLGIRSGASKQQIKSAYRRAMKRLHPDVNKSREATEEFLLVQRAYEFLSSEESRVGREEVMRGTGWSASASRSAVSSRKEPGVYRKVRVAKSSQHVSPPFYRAAERALRRESAKALSTYRVARTVWYAYLSVVAGAAVGFVLLGLGSLSAGNSFEGWAASTIGVMLFVMLFMVINAGIKAGFGKR